MFTTKAAVAAIAIQSARVAFLRCRRSSLPVGYESSTRSVRIEGHDARRLRSQILYIVRARSTTAAFAKGPLALSREIALALAMGTRQIEREA